MKIMEMLDRSWRTDIDIRITFEGRWMVKGIGVWEVYEKKKNHKTTTLIVSTSDEEEAVRNFLQN